MRKIHSSIIRTDFLFPKRSFITGLASILCLGGNPRKFNLSNSDSEADYKAIKSDWSMVGQDFEFVMTNNNGKDK